MASSHWLLEYLMLMEPIADFNNFDMLRAVRITWRALEERWNSVPPSRAPRSTSGLWTALGCRGNVRFCGRTSHCASVAVRVQSFTSMC